MAGFAREHLRPLVGSAGLHLLLIAIVAGMALRWTKPQEPVQLAIEGVVVDAKDLPKSVRSGKAIPAPRPATVPEAVPAPAKEALPPPVEDTPARERAEAQAAERAREQRAQAEQLKAREQAAAIERRRQEQAEAQKTQAAEAARRKAEAEAERKKAAEAEAEAKRAREAQETAAREAKARAAREADLQRQLAAEEAEGLALARSGVKDEYRALLTQAIERNWIRPPSARAGLACTLYVNQAAGGTVVDVRLGTCNGDEAVRESIVNAVYRASPLPPPSDPRAFERRLEILFRPTE
jgi:colicin import membrane protein